jgi:hypothetical protein
MDRSPANIVDICNQSISGMDEDCSVSDMLISKVEPLYSRRTILTPALGAYSRYLIMEDQRIGRREDLEPRA